MRSNMLQAAAGHVLVKVDRGHTGFCSSGIKRDSLPSSVFQPFSEAVE